MSPLLHTSGRTGDVAYRRGFQQFQYDSDGEKFSNMSNIISSLFK